MDQIQHNLPSPEDRLDSDTADAAAVDEILANRAGDRNTDAPSGRTGEITNMEVQHQPTDADRGETDPLSDRPHET